MRRPRRKLAAPPRWRCSSWSATEGFYALFGSIDFWTFVLFSYLFSWSLFDLYLWGAVPGFRWNLPVAQWWYVKLNGSFFGLVLRQTFNSYNWHLLFLIGGGSALGHTTVVTTPCLVVKPSTRSGCPGEWALGLADWCRAEASARRIWTWGYTEVDAPVFGAKLGCRHLSSSPWLLIVELTLVRDSKLKASKSCGVSMSTEVIVGATTFVSHTVAALVLMPLVVQLGEEAGVERIAVLLGALSSWKRAVFCLTFIRSNFASRCCEAFACSTACALPMTSFPNVGAQTQLGSWVEDLDFDGKSEVCAARSLFVFEVNSLMAADDLGKPWLSVKNFLMVTWACCSDYKNGSHLKSMEQWKTCWVPFHHFSETLWLKQVPFVSKTTSKTQGWNPNDHHVGGATGHCRCGGCNWCGRTLLAAAFRLSHRPTSPELNKKLWLMMRHLGASVEWYGHPVHWNWQIERLSLSMFTCDVDIGVFDLVARKLESHGQSRYEQLAGHTEKTDLRFSWTQRFWRAFNGVKPWPTKICRVFGVLT